MHKDFFLNLVHTGNAWCKVNTGLIHWLKDWSTVTRWFSFIAVVPSQTVKLAYYMFTIPIVDQSLNV